MTCQSNKNNNVFNKVLTGIIVVLTLCVTYYNHFSPLVHRNQYFGFIISIKVSNIF